MTNYIILFWNNPHDVSIVTLPDGGPMVFTDYNEAKGYANTNGTRNWKVVSLE